MWNGPSCRWYPTYGKKMTRTGSNQWRWKFRRTRRAPTRCFMSKSRNTTQRFRRRALPFWWDPWSSHFHPNQFWLPNSCLQLAQRSCRDKASASEFHRPPSKAFNRWGNSTFSSPRRHHRRVCSSSCCYRLQRNRERPALVEGGDHGIKKTSLLLHNQYRYRHTVVAQLTVVRNNSRTSLVLKDRVATKKAHWRKLFEN